MKIKDYIEKSADTAIYPHRGQYGGITYVLCGLAGENGEVFELLKKVMRDNGGKIEDVSRIKSEVGDILWYWSQLLYESGVSCRDNDEILVDDLQTQIYNKWMGDSEAPDKTTSDFVLLQVGIMAEGHILIGNLFKSYLKIKSEEDVTPVMKEISQLSTGIFSFLCLFLSNLGITMSEVMQMNLDKLSARKIAGKLKGSGEDLNDR